MVWSDGWLEDSDYFALVEWRQREDTSLLFKSCAIEIKGRSDVQLAWYQIAQWRGTAMVRHKGKTFVPISQMSIKCPK